MSTPNIYTKNTNECRFYPVQCTDEIFQTLAAQEGYVYFVTDKKKLYLGKNNEMIPMCANSGIFYGVKPVEYDNSGNKPDPNVVFYFDEIEGEDKPEEDDLILNVGTEDYPDGCFYRVVNIVDDSFETVRLTLQGSGSGGSGTGGGPTGGSFSIAIVGDRAKVYSSTSESINIAFRGYYNGIDENRISKVSFTKKGDIEPFYTTTKEMSFNETHTVDLIEFIDLFDSTRTTVTIAIEDLYGSERSTNFTIQIVELSLKAIQPELIYSLDSTYQYACSINGATSGVSSKQITYTFYNENNLSVPVSIQTQELSITDEGTQQKTLDLNSLPHGIYVMRVVASAKISGSDTSLYSNELVHKFGRFVNLTEPLLMIKTPEVTEQYTNIPLNYLLVTSEANKQYTLDIRLNGISKTQLTIQSNSADSYLLYFEDKGTYTLACTILELALEHIEYLNIVPYTGNLPVIDPNRDDLMLYLNPKGKSNEATDRGEWRNYNDKIYNGVVPTAQLAGLHYGKSNGWLMNKEGTSYLQLSSGASLTLDNFKPFGIDPSTKLGMTIELDFEIKGVLDYNTELIRCISKNKNDATYVGFVITGDRFYFYNSRLNGGVNAEGKNVGPLVSLNIIEDKRIRLTFVIEPNISNDDIEYPMCYTYLNGKLSAATIYDKTDAFKDSTDSPAKLQIYSNDAQIKIYNVRFYSSALNDRAILNNYTASLATLAERQTQYDTNNVFDANGEVKYALVAAEDYDLQIPYMKITGGWATELESKWQLKNKTNANVGLPTGKKDYRLIDVEVKYPKNDYFAEYKDYKFINQFKSGKPMSQAFGEKPSNGGAIMYAQGTSSLEYPVKNLRLRFKNESDWYTVRPDLSPVEIICMKADYMESSGSHNTGAANLIDALYEGVGIETPGQKHFGGEDKETIVTCIKGHPCLIFYSETGEKDSYKYIGKYNLNLDKATPEPFGFDHDDEAFGYLNVGDEYYKVTYYDEKDPSAEHWIGQFDPSNGGDYFPGQEETKAIVQEGEKVNSIHCFEFLDNTKPVCNFLPVDGYSYEDSWYGTFINSDNKAVPGWTIGFESRYPEDRVGYHDADSLYPLASWLNELYNLYTKELQEGKDPKEITYTYKYIQADTWQDFVAYYIKTENGMYTEAYPTKENFASNTYYTRVVESSRFSMDSLERFKREYQCYLDKNFLLTYYLVTEALLMVDSRVKNMMIATWGKEIRTYKDLDGKEHTTNNYIFYPIFYDMDTMLGLDNTGVYRFNYYDEDTTDSSIYNGDEVLWNFVRDALQDELIPWYGQLENSLLKANEILPYFNNNQANMANEAFYNGDATYKYINPAREGYWGNLDDPNAKNFLYAAQGDRSLMREWFINNRMNFLRGKYNSSDYQSSNRIEFRWYYPKTSDLPDTDKLKKSSAAVPPDGKFTFTSLKTSYAGVKLGANGTVYNERFEGEMTKEIILPEASSANGTEAYLLGLSNLTDLGDLSNKYMQKFIISSNDVRLKNLTLGNPHKDYSNPYWRPGEAQSQAISLRGCTYLETFNLQNCDAYNNTLDFANCPAIQKILLTGSSTTGITLPENGMLNELRLPVSIKDLRIVSHSSLNPDNFTLGTYDYDNNYKDERGYVIMGGNGHYTNDYSQLQKLYIVDTPIDTYEMVRTAGDLSDYYLKGFEWTITENDTQYCIRDMAYFEANKESITFYEYNKDTGYSVYSKENYPESGSLYERFDMIKDGKVQCIPVLEYLQTKSIMGGTKHAEALVGTITISINGVAVNELEIYERYKDVYPDVKIKYSNMNVEEALKIQFYRVDADSLEEDESVESLEPYFTTLTSGNYTLAQLIDSPNFVTPIKSSTTLYDFEFKGEWIDWNDKTTYYQDSYHEGADYSTLFSKTTPTKNMDLVPKFYAKDRIYKIKFYDYNYTPGDEALFIVDCKYEDNLGNRATNPKVKYIYRPSDDKLKSDERYSLKGWQRESDFNKNYAITNLEDVIVRDNMNFFAYYEIEDATQVSSPIDIFDIKYQLINAFGNRYDIYAVGLKDEYRDMVGGKITLPSVNVAGKNEVIKGINNFHSITNNSVEIYFLNNAQHTILADQVFAESKIIKVNLPQSIQVIGNQAFRRNYDLENIVLSDNIKEIGVEAFQDASKVSIAKLPSSLIQLGDRAFNNCKNITISELPENLNVIPAQCFMGASKVSVSHFPKKENGAVCTIGLQAFNGCDSSGSVKQIVINSPWVRNGKTSINNASEIFWSGYTGITSLVIHSGIMTENEDESQLLVDLFGNRIVPIEVQTLTEA